jgi:hypothetical protein
VCGREGARSDVGTYMSAFLTTSDGVVVLDAADHREQHPARDR